MIKAQSKIKRDDTVVVIAGRDKGKRGKVLRVYPDNGRALVEGINFITKAVKPNPQLNQSGGFVTKEAAIVLSNLMLHCSTCQKGVKTSVRVSPDGEKERICKKCNGAISKG